MAPAPVADKTASSATDNTQGKQRFFRNAPILLDGSLLVVAVVAVGDRAGRFLIGAGTLSRTSVSERVPVRIRVPGLGIGRVVVDTLITVLVHPITHLGSTWIHPREGVVAVAGGADGLRHAAV